MARCPESTTVLEPQDPVMATLHGTKEKSNYPMLLLLSGGIKVNSVTLIASFFFKECTKKQL